MSYIIFVRMPTRNLVTIVNTEYTHYEEKIAEFDTYEEAEELIETHILSPFDWEIVEVKV